MRREAGRYERTAVAGETVSAFIPDPLPPTSPPLSLDAGTRGLLQSAEQKLGRLGLSGGMVPSIEWFMYAFVRKEAVVSSQIEGTQATLVDLLAFEASAEGAASTAPTEDVQEVCNYIDALAYARRQLQSPKGLPLSMRLLNEAHRRLMKGGRGAKSAGCSAISRSTSIEKTTCRHSSAQRWCTCSSRPSTLISTGTAASADC